MFTSLLAAVSLSSLLLRASAQRPGQTVLFQSVLEAAPGKCLTAASNTDGAPVVIGDCDINENNSWLVPKGINTATTLQIFGDKCLDVTDGVNADGTKLQIWTCAVGNTNQQFVSGGFDQLITWAGKNKCIDVTNGNSTNGNRIQIWDCDHTNGNQLWNTPAVTQPKSFTIASKTHPEYCISAAIQGINASVVILHCNASDPAQIWSDPLHIGQLVIHDNLCATPRANKTSDGINIVTTPCDANNAVQRWDHQSAANYIVNRGIFHECLDLRDGNFEAGIPLQIWSCSELGSQGDNPNQDWVVTDTF